MSQSDPETFEESTLRFPNGHSLSQVKRNAKRLSKESDIPLNRALDTLAREALGVPDSSLYWAQAVKILKLCHERFSEESINIDEAAQDHLGPEFKTPIRDLIVVVIDIKDAFEFRNTGPWKQNAQLSVSMCPAIVAWLAHAYAEEEQNAISDEYIDDAINRCGEYFCYYCCPDALNTAKDAVADIVARNYFPPDAVWKDGKVYCCTNI